MKDMDTIKKAAEAIRGKYKLEGDVNTLLTANVGKEWDELQAKIAKGLTDEELAVAMSPLKGAIALVNDLRRNERLDQLKGMTVPDAVADYLRTQTVQGYAVNREKVDGNSLLTLVSNAPVELAAFDFVAAVFPTEKNGIIDMCCIFADNLAKLNHKGDERAAVSRRGLSPTYVSMRKARGWDIPAGKLSKSVLAEHLTQIVGILCPGQDIRMLSTDVTFLLDSIIQGKSMADKAGAIVMRDEKTIIHFIFRAAYTRLNKLPYDFQNKTRGGSEPLSVRENKAMAEEKPKAEKLPVVTGEKVSTPKAAAKAPKASKKSGAKASKK